MVVIVLTGGIGSGKSVASEYFGGRGASIVDLDEVAHEVMTPGSTVLTSVATAFGEQVLRPDGSLHRARLAQACFADRASARRLDEIVHPAVAHAATELLRDLSQRPTPPGVVVVEVPLLVEAPSFARMADVVLAISAPEPLRIERAVSRGLDRADVVRRVRVQAPDSARSALADVVIENDGTLDEFREALRRFWDERFDPGASGG